MTGNDTGDFEMLSLAAVTRNVMEFLKLDSPGGKASVTEGSLSPEGREQVAAPGETVKER